MIKARVKETSTTTGTATLSLDGAVSGFRSFLNAFGTGQQCYYVIIDGTAWEVGIGVVTSGSPNTLTRDTVLDSSAAGAKLSLGAGTKSVFNDLPANVLITQARSFKEIYGMTYQNAAGDVVNDLDIASGGASDSTGVKWIVTAALTKRLDAAWAVGSGNGGLDTGAIANSDYYIWAIIRSDTGVTDYLFSLSSTAPTMPASYDYKRLIGWFKRVGGAIVLFKTYETEGGGLEFLWSVPTLDINLANTLTTSRRADAVKVPLNFSVIALLNVVITDVSAGGTEWIYCPDQTDAAPSQTVAPLANIIHTNSFPAAVMLRVRTSAAGLIAARSTQATVDNYAVSTMGFLWARRN